MSKLNEKINSLCNRIIVSNQKHEGLGVMLLGTVNSWWEGEHTTCIENMWQAGEIIILILQRETKHVSHLLANCFKRWNIFVSVTFKYAFVSFAELYEKSGKLWCASLSNRSTDREGKAILLLSVLVFQQRRWCNSSKQRYGKKLNCNTFSATMTL